MDIKGNRCTSKTIDEIIASLPKNLRKKSAQIREVIDREISQSATIRLQTCLNLIQHFDDEIKILETQIFNYVYIKHERERKIIVYAGHW